MIITRKIKYLYRWLRFRHGFGVHSPYAFSFINNVIEERSLYYGYEDIANKVAQIKIHPNFTKEYSRQYYHLLFRISHFFKPRRIFIVGHQSGECLLYLKSNLPDVSCVLIDSDRKRLEATQQLLQNEKNVSILESTADQIKGAVESQLKECEPFDLFYFHQSIDLETKQKAMECCLERKSQNPTLFVVDYIEGCDVAIEFWNWIKEKHDIAITFDLMRLGIAIYHPKLKKQDYRLAF